MTVRAKFKVDAKGVAGDTQSVRLTPVVGGQGNQENDQFFKYTPGGSIDLQVMNPEAADQFNIGQEFYVDFTPVA